ncbi:hypothetical protein B0H13DRAFT_2308408 [Mycena leptocephala]|nr:hypothetical protein B0H13DRAFT_2308408 [Mycena leptocephala]
MDQDQTLRPGSDRRSPVTGYRFFLCMSSPPAKRHRTEDAPITRSDIWHNDGSVVLQPGNTQFRVHWSVLALHSSFFRDMQGLPQPPDQPSVEGCPVVELPDDTEDVEYLLKALYSPTFLTHKALPIQAVGALIRLGQIARLALENPTTLEEFDAVTLKSLAAMSIVPYSGISIDIATLASENNLLSLLPSAYFFLVTGPSDRAKLFGGIIRRRDGAPSLSLIDLHRCIIGRDRLLRKQFQPGYTLGWLRRWEYNDCTKFSPCKLVRENLLSTFMDNGIVGALRLPFSKNSFCAACAQHMEEYVAAGGGKYGTSCPVFLTSLPGAS